MSVYSDDFDIFCNFVGVHSFLPSLRVPWTQALHDDDDDVSFFVFLFFFDSELGNVMGERWMKALTLTV